MFYSVEKAKINKVKGRTSVVVIVIVALIAVAAGFYLQLAKQSKPEQPSFAKAIILPNSKAITGVNFSNHFGEDFSGKDLQGRWSIIFFGFTNCPDICPTTMHTLKQVYADLRAAGHDDFYRVIMVTVDPARDSAEKLANYVPFFDPDFIGLTGAHDITTEFARQLGILFVAHAADDAGNYDVDHSTSLILINPQGEMAGVIPAPHKKEEISGDLIALANHFSSSPSNSKSTSKSTNHKPQVTKKSYAASDNNSLQLEQAWIRPAPPSAQSMAGYFELYNSSSQDIKIVAVESEQFEMAMMHETTIENGTASMNHMNELTVPAHGTVVFKPMALHLMLVGANPIPKKGSVVSVTLIDDSNTRYEQNIEVREDPRGQ